jgi:hypothetical protein
MNGHLVTAAGPSIFIRKLSLVSWISHQGFLTKWIHLHATVPSLISCNSQHDSGNLPTQSFLTTHHMRGRGEVIVTFGDVRLIEKFDHKYELINGPACATQDQIQTCPDQL